MVEGTNVEAVSSQAAASTADSSHPLLHGIWDRAKAKAQAAGHTAMDLAHKGATAAEKAAHSPAAHKAAQVATEVGNDAIAPERHDVENAIRAGKKGDIHGVVESSLPLAKEAALGPHILLIRKAKEEALKQAEKHARSGANGSQNRDVEKILGHVHIDHSGATNDAPKQ